MFSKLLRLPLQLKFTLTFAFIITLATALTFVHFTRQQESLALELLQDKVNSSSRAVVIAVENALQRNDFNNLSLILKSADNDEDISFIVVLDPSGEELARFKTVPPELNIRDLAKFPGLNRLSESMQVVLPIHFPANEQGALLLGYSLNNLQRKLDQNMGQAIFIYLAVLVVGILIAAVFSRLITRNVNQLIRAANDFADGRKIEIDLLESDELGKLGKAFLQMEAKIGEGMQNLSAANERLHREIAEHKVARGKIIDTAKFPDENPFPVFRISNRGELLFGNPAFSSIFHQDQFEMGRQVPDFWRKAVDEAMASNAKKEVDVSLDNKVFSFQIVPLMDKGYINIYGSDITHRKISEDKISAYSLELERSNKELQEFAYIASHDLQEPLRKIIAFGDRLKANLADLTPRNNEYLERMQSASLRMQAFIDDLLDLSRVTTRTNPFAPVDLEKVVYKVLDDLEIRIKQTGGTVKLQNLPTIEADSFQMGQLFQNLISNALKFHREGIPPEILVGGSINGQDMVKIIVEDNGLGFEEKYAERIFKPFERLHGRGAYEGTGIGLAICKKVVARHGGDIAVQARPNNGSAFIISLPRKRSNPGDPGREP